MERQWNHFAQNRKRILWSAVASKWKSMPVTDWQQRGEHRLSYCQSTVEDRQARAFSRRMRRDFVSDGAWEKKIKFKPSAWIQTQRFILTNSTTYKTKREFKEKNIKFSDHFRLKSMLKHEVWLQGAHRKRIQGAHRKRSSYFPLEPVSSEISGLLLFVSYFASQSKGIKFGKYFFDVCCVN